MLDRLPELFAQLEVSGAIDFGLWPARPDVDAGEDPHPPSAWMQTFVFEAGTVRQALDALVEANSVLSWEAADGRVMLRREPRSPRTAQLLAAQVGVLDVAGIPEVDYRVATALSWARNRALQSLPEPDFLEMRARVSFGRPEVAHRFPGRRPISMHLWPEQAEQTLEDVLHRLTPAAEHAFWYAFHAESSPAAGGFQSNRRLRIAVTTWSSVRRQLRTSQLVEALHEHDERLHGYRDVKIRIEDAQRELQRRHHFNPGEVRAALMAGGNITKLVEKADNAAWYRVYWMTRLEDTTLNRIVFDQVRRLDPQENIMHPLTAFPPPHDPKFDATLLPRWRNVAATFPVPKVQEYAGYVVDLHQWLEDGGPASGRVRPSLFY